MAMINLYLPSEVSEKPQAFIEKIRSWICHSLWRVIIITFASCSSITEHNIWWNEATAAELAAGEASYVAVEVLGIRSKNYPIIAEAASQGDIKAIQQLQRVTGHGDAAGGLGQHLLIQKILEQVGDSLFAEALSEQSNEVILAHGYLSAPNYPITIEEFPHTYEIIRLAE